MKTKSAYKYKDLCVYLLLLKCSNTKRSKTSIDSLEKVRMLQLLQ